ncbi:MULTISPECIES: glycosyltransferase [unclassified Marinobacter]|uniref:glycosyltransferase n=1 Tax=unclassified Marinobacter TaxID=83889 RepID=UPI0018F114C0|nr:MULTISPECIES: glycosyltransferase [unclassified Marinobacter]
MRIAFFIPDLRGGGAERVCLLLAREFLAKGHDVDLVLLRKQGMLLDQLPAEARVFDLRASRVRKGFLPLVRYLKSEQPDALLASMWPLTTLSVVAARAALYTGKVVVSEHSALSCSPQNAGLSGMALRASMRWVHAHADGVIGVSKGVVKDLHGLGLPAKSGLVIHNPVAISDEMTIPDSWASHPWVNAPKSQRLLAVGSIKPAKDYPTLLRGIKKVVDSGKDVSLLILGVGPLQNQLEMQCREMGIAEHVHFGGFVNSPGPFYRAAGLFILSSAWEGFGNVIVEAMAAGTPVVSTDCRSGPAEILEYGRYGRLVPVADVAALANAIIGSLEATHNAEALKARAAEFTPEKIAQKYLDILSA